MHPPLLLLRLQLLGLLGGVRIGWFLLLVAVPDVKQHTRVQQRRSNMFKV